MANIISNYLSGITNLWIYLFNGSHSALKDSDVIIAQ